MIPRDEIRDMPTYQLAGLILLGVVVFVAAFLAFPIAVFALTFLSLLWAAVLAVADMIQSEMKHNDRLKRP